MKTIVVFIVGLLIATAWAQIDQAHGAVWLPAHTGTLNGRGLPDGPAQRWRRGVALYRPAENL